MTESTIPVALVAAEAPPRTTPSLYPEPFASMMAGRVKRPLGDRFNLVNFGVNLVRLEPGGVSSLRHAHRAQDEFIYVLSGEPTLVTNAGSTRLTPGMCAGFSAGTGDAHHLVNQTEGMVEYLEVGDRSPDDSVEYPDDDLQATAGTDGKWKFTHKDGTPYKAKDPPSKTYSVPPVNPPVSARNPMTKREHWQRVYQSKTPKEVSWYTPHLTDSMKLITEVSAPSSRIIDVGAGASTLVDDLVAAGYGHVTVLDLSPIALAAAKKRLRKSASTVTWLTGDVTAAPLDDSSFDVWHDRAVFHFMTREWDRRAYVNQLLRCVAPGGHVIIGTFSLTGPARCSGLEVKRYDAKGLAAELGTAFELTAQLEAVHATPAGREQNFVYCRFKRKS